MCFGEAYNRLRSYLPSSTNVVQNSQDFLKEIMVHTTDGILTSKETTPPDETEVIDHNLSSNDPDEDGTIDDNNPSSYPQTRRETSTTLDTSESINLNAELLLNVAKNPSSFSAVHKRKLCAINNYDSSYNAEQVNGCGPVNNHVNIGSWVGNKRVRAMNHGSKPVGGDEVILLWDGRKVGTATLQLSNNTLESHATSLHNTCLSKWQKEHEKLVVIYKCNIPVSYTHLTLPTTSRV